MSRVLITAGAGGIGRAMADASICGLGQAAANPLFSVLMHFPEEVI